MKVYTKSWEQDLPVSLEEAWSFFSRPENLQAITPDFMNFRILSDIKGREMYEGMIINYTVSPLLGIPLRWTTEITHCKPMFYFIDEQRSGPFALWHHEHHFEATPHGVRMTDRLSYALGFGWMGEWVNKFMIGNRIEAIFAHREEVLKSKFK